MDELITNHVRFMETAIMLAKEKQFAVIFLDLARRDGYVDPHEWCREAQFVNTEWNCKALVGLFKMLNRVCPGLVEFKKQKGFIGMIKFPAIKLSEMGVEMAKMLKNNKELTKSAYPI